MHVLVDQGIAGYGVARTFQAVGVQTALHELGRDSWPEGVVSALLDYESVLSTGQVTY